MELLLERCMSTSVSVMRPRNAMTYYCSDACHICVCDETCKYLGEIFFESFPSGLVLSGMLEQYFFHTVAYVPCVWLWK